MLGVLGFRESMLWLLWCVSPATFVVLNRFIGMHGDCHWEAMFRFCASNMIRSLTRLSDAHTLIRTMSVGIRVRDERRIGAEGIARCPPSLDVELCYMIIDNR